MATFACSDLHGRLDLYELIKKSLNPEDKVYFLGDAGDRGPWPWETIKAIYNDPQFIYMKGNHEDLLVNAGLFKFCNARGSANNPVDLLYANGGKKTLKGLSAEKNPVEWIEKLKALPSYFLYKNKQGKDIHLSHAGFTPWVDWFNDEQMDIPQEFALLWDRYHMEDDWVPDYMIDDGSIFVHGHTPIQLFNSAEWEPGPFWYFNHRKVDLDNGAYATGIACLLNLDDLSGKIIYNDLDKKS